ncbi:MAG: hypothetical protein ABIR56_19335 [Polaromonas sp.]
MSRREFFSRTLEPEQGGILKTLFITHGVTGLAGAILGLLPFAWLYRSGLHRHRGFFDHLRAAVGLSDCHPA